MTLPDERYRAIQQAKRLLQELCDPRQTPRVPSVIRQRASGALRHFPADYELEKIADSCPDYLDKISFAERLRNDQSKQ